MFRITLRPTTLCFVLLFAASATGQTKPTTLQELREARKVAAHRQRRLIFNNDGNEPVYVCQDDVSAAGLLKHRTSPLAHSQVASIFYCTWSSPFGCFTHHTNVGSLFTATQAGFSKNQTQNFFDKGIDPLTVMTDFGKRNAIEVFWSMRMNDTHDSSGAWYGPLMFAASPLKQQHPEWLVGSKTKRSVVGGWTAVDYAREEIRELAFRYIEEVCKNYDVTGIELDFFRHPVLFKTQAQGDTATPENRDQLTSLLRRIRKMSEEVGLERGRPILIAIRVPDSVEFCHEIGIDLDTWLKDHLVDLLITTGYYRLNPWQYSVKLGQTYDVPVYAGLSESRVRGETRFHRNSVASYRGRAANAWSAGVDGVYMFNFFNPNSPIWNELGDPKSLQHLDKLFFATVRNGNPSSTLVGGRQYSSLAELSPTRPQSCSPTKPLLVQLPIGDDPATAKSLGHTPQVTLHLEIPLLKQADQITTNLNGTKLTGGKLTQGWIDYHIPLSAIKQGLNQVEIAVIRAAPNTDNWPIVFDGRNKPGNPWRRDRGSKQTLEQPGEEAFFIADRGTQSGDYLFYRASWGADLKEKTIVEARVKTVSGSSFIILSDGVSGERLRLATDHISLFHNASIRYNMDTSSDFHVYRIVAEGNDVQVFVDGTLRLDGRGQLKHRSGYSRNEIAFGAANSGEVGEAYWDFVRAQTSSLSCHDIVIAVKYRRDN